MSLRTSDRPTAQRLGVRALSVFEELLSKETADGLIHLMEHIIQELDLNPDDMTTMILSGGAPYWSSAPS